MANKTDGESENAVIKGGDQAQHIERALVAPDGTITIPLSEAKLKSVDVADIDLLLSFADGTFVIIPNGALDAIGDSLHPVVFSDNSDSDFDPTDPSRDNKSTLGDLFKMVGISNHAKAGSLRVVSNNVEATKALGEVDAQKEPDNEHVTSSDLRLPDTIIAPAPMVKTGMGPGFLPVPSNQLDYQDPVVPLITPRPPVYRAGPKPTVEPEKLAPTITLDANITDDDIINSAEARGPVAITGTVGGDAKVGDTVTLTVNGIHTTGLVQTDMTFSINVSGADLVADDDKVVDAGITTTDGVNSGTATDTEGYGIDVTVPVPTPIINLGANITADDIINITEAGGTVAITGSVGGDAKAGDTVTLTVNGITSTGLVHADNTFSIDVAGSDLVADSDKIIDASITTTDAAGNSGTATDGENYTVDITAPAPTVTLNANITADNIINSAEASGTVAITGTVGGDAQTGDTVTLTVNGADSTGLVQADMTFSINVSGADLAADGDKIVDVSITTTDGAGNSGTATGIERYTVDLTTPLPTVTLNSITADNSINIAEAGGSVAVTGTVAGEFQAGALVTLTVNGSSYTGGAAADGSFSINVLGSDLVADPGHIINASVTTTNAAGNPGTASDPDGQSYSVDTIAPTAPTIELASDTGTVGDLITSNAALNFSAAPGGVTRTYTVDGIAGSSFSAPTADGSHSVVVTDTDSAGNTAAGSLTFTLDNSITTPAVALTSDSGIIGDLLTNDASLTFSAAAGDVTRTYTVDGVIAGSNYTAPTADGSHTVVVTDTDTAGNQSTDSITFSLDTTAPTATLALNSITADNILNIAEAGTAVTVTGVVTGEFQTGDTIMLTAGVNTYTGFPNADGSFSINVLGSDLANGSSVDASVLAHDAAGNSATFTATHNYTIDQIAPATPVITLIHDTATGADNSDLVTSNGNVSLSGIEAGAAVEYSTDGGTTWSSGFSAVEGNNNVQVRQTDAAGNTSGFGSLSFVLDTLAPTTPIVALTSDSGSSNSDLITNNSSLTIDPATGRTFSVDGGVASSSYSTPTTDGFHTVIVTDTDTAGNQASGSLSFNLDSTAPDVPSGQSFIYTEKQPSGAVLGTIAASDSVGVNGYRIASGNDDNYFSIDNSGRITLTELGSLSAANEFSNSFPLVIEVSDAAGNTNTQTVTLDVIVTADGVDTTPPVVTPNQTFSYAENQASGAVVASVAASDTWGVNGYRFSNETNISTDNFFTIANNGQITLTAAGLAGTSNNFESGDNTFNLGVQARDAAGHWSATEIISVNVSNVNEAPTSISLSTNTLAENSFAGTVIAILSAADVDAGDKFTYTLVVGNGTNDADNGLVSIVGNELRVNGSIDFETNPSLAINVQVTDAGGLSYTKALTVTVNDVNDAAVLSAGSASVTESNIAADISTSGTLTISDVDSAQTFVA
ncbi:MAG: Ig-like domain-containing protein, partial [Desulfuromonadaceae bacterium]